MAKASVQDRMAKARAARKGGKTAGAPSLPDYEKSPCAHMAVKLARLANILDKTKKRISRWEVGPRYNDQIGQALSAMELSGDLKQAAAILDSLHDQGCKPTVRRGRVAFIPQPGMHVLLKPGYERYYPMLAKGPLFVSSEYEPGDIDMVPVSVGDADKQPSGFAPKSHITG